MPFDLALAIENLNDRDNPVTQGVRDAYPELSKLFDELDEYRYAIREGDLISRKEVEASIYDDIH